LDCEAEKPGIGLESFMRIIAQQQVCQGGQLVFLINSGACRRARRRRASADQRASSRGPT
jgi:hypothetical protein